MSALLGEGGVISDSVRTATARLFRAMEATWRGRVAASGLPGLRLLPYDASVASPPAARALRGRGVVRGRAKLVRHAG